MVVFCSVFKDTSGCYFGLEKFMGWLTKCQWWLSSSSTIDVPLLWVYPTWTASHGEGEAFPGCGEQRGWLVKLQRKQWKGVTCSYPRWLGQGGREIVSAEGLPRNLNNTRFLKTDLFLLWICITRIFPPLLLSGLHIYSLFSPPQMTFLLLPSPVPFSSSLS